MDLELINEVLFQMQNSLTNQQLMELKDVLEKLPSESFNRVIHSSEELLEKFLSTKRLEGRSEKTLLYYENTVRRMLTDISKSVLAITTDDIRRYLSNYQKNSKISKVTVDNIRRNLSSFFSWLEDENYILKNPVRRIHKIKTTVAVKDTYTEDELERLRDACHYERDLAIIDLLSSTGMRIGELVNLDRENVSFSERECIVHGKGDKERIVYFDSRTKLHLQNYLDSRADDNPALFVGLRNSKTRLQIGGVEVMLRKLGKSLGIKRCHPHKFRRTMATIAIDKGMPIEQVQKILGHEKIDTTMHYVMVKQSNVKMMHRKIMG